MQLSDTASQRILLPVRASTIFGSFALALLAFLLRKKYLELDDPAISSLSVFMRWFLVFYLAMFAYLAYAITRPIPGDSHLARKAEVAASLSAEDRRQAAYDLHRALRLPSSASRRIRLRRAPTAPNSALTYSALARMSRAMTTQTAAWVY